MNKVENPTFAKPAIPEQAPTRREAPDVIRQPLRQAPVPTREPKPLVAPVPPVRTPVPVGRR